MTELDETPLFPDAIGHILMDILTDTPGEGPPYTHAFRWPSVDSPGVEECDDPEWLGLSGLWRIIIRDLHGSRMCTCHPAPMPWALGYTQRVRNRRRRS